MRVVEKKIKERKKKGEKRGEKGKRKRNFRLQRKLLTFRFSSNHD